MFDKLSAIEDIKYEITHCNDSQRLELLNKAVDTLQTGIVNHFKAELLSEDILDAKALHRNNEGLLLFEEVFQKLEPLLDALFQMEKPHSFMIKKLHEHILKEKSFFDIDPRYIDFEYFIDGRICAYIQSHSFCGERDSYDLFISAEDFIDLILK